jgi:dUTP pyrophosphatase
MIIPHPLVEFEEVEELNNTERGEGGFGSTGK